MINELERINQYNYATSHSKAKQSKSTENEIRELEHCTLEQCMLIELYLEKNNSLSREISSIHEETIKSFKRLPFSVQISQRELDPEKMEERRKRERENRENFKISKDEFIKRLEHVCEICKSKLAD